MELNSPVPLETKEAAALSGYLLALESILGGINYSVSFETNLFSLDGIDLSIESVLLLAHPRLRLNKAHIEISNLEEMKAEVMECLLSPFAGCNIAFNAQNISSGFWWLVEQCVEYEEAIIYKYNSWEGLPDCPVMWYFLWVIHNPSQGRSVVLYGYASD